MAPLETMFSVFSLFFHATLIHLLIPKDYDTETDDVDQNGIDDANRNGNGVQQPDTNTVQPINEFDRDANKVDTIEQQHTTSTISTDEQIAEQIDTNEIGVPESSQPTASIDNLNHIPVDLQSCDINNGGCEQTCNMVPNEQNNGNIVECSCNEGFYLDKEGGTKCLGKLILCLSFRVFNAFSNVDRF